jgi:hypothetical protein
MSIDKIELICMMSITEDPLLKIPDGFPEDLNKLSLKLASVRTFTARIEEIKTESDEDKPLKKRRIESKEKMTIEKKIKFLKDKYPMLSINKLTYYHTCKK